MPDIDFLYEKDYVTCPRCHGGREVYAYTKIGNGYTPSEGEYFQCPRCHGTGDIHKDDLEEENQ